MSYRKQWNQVKTSSLRIIDIICCGETNALGVKNIMLCLFNINTLFIMNIWSMYQSFKGKNKMTYLWIGLCSVLCLLNGVRWTLIQLLGLFYHTLKQCLIYSWLQSKHKAELLRQVYITFPFLVVSMTLPLVTCWATQRPGNLVPQVFSASCCLVSLSP